MLFFLQGRPRSASGAPRSSGSVFIANGFPSVNGFIISFFQYRQSAERAPGDGFVVDGVKPMDIAAEPIIKRGDAFASPLPYPALLALLRRNELWQSGVFRPG